MFRRFLQKRIFALVYTPKQYRSKLLKCSLAIRFDDDLYIVEIIEDILSAIYLAYIFLEISALRHGWRARRW